MRGGRVGDLIAALPDESAELVRALGRSAAAEGATLYMVGGPVRDWLLGRPLRDVDLLVDPGAAVESIARAAVPPDAQVTAHDRFGTVKLVAGAAQVDLAGARRESYARMGALPKVESGTLEEDLLRRDFSINALAIRLGEPGEAIEVIDPDDGLRDLEAGRLRILHPRSFHDDPTRALRAARLSPRLGFHLSRASRSALRDAIRDGAFGAVSGDRIRREFERLFTDASLGLDPAVALRRLAEWHVLPALEPGLGVPREALAPLRRLGRSIAEPPWRGPRLRPWVSGLCVWLAPLKPSLRRRTLERLAVRGEGADRIGGFPRDRDARARALAAGRGRGAVDATLAGIDDDRLLALYASVAPTLRRRIARWANEDRLRRPPVTGDELVALGFSGPAVGRALARIRAAFLDGALANREEALALAREMARSRPSGRGRGGRRRAD